MSRPGGAMDAVLERRPGAQLLTLDGGRLAARHGRGLSLWDGPPALAVRALWEAVDGRRPAREVVEEARGAITRAMPEAPPPPGVIERILGELVGELLGEVESRAPGESVDARAGRAVAERPASPDPPPDSPLVTVVGEGALAARAAEELGALLGEGAVDAIRSSRDGSPRSALWLAVSAGGTDPSGRSYRHLLELQGRALEEGAVLLPLTVDPDGVRLGPAAVAGAGPCLACAQLAALERLGLGAEGALELAGRFETVLPPPGQGSEPADPAVREALREAAREAAALVAPRAALGGPRPRLVGAVRLWPRGSGDGSGAFSGAIAPKNLPVRRHPDCPLCGDRELPMAAGTVSEVALGRGLEALAVAGARDGTGARVSSQGPPTFLDRSETRRAEARGDDADDAVRTVAVVGGGTAGYLAALALRRALPHLEVTLIESPEVPVIGVGEATTPLLPQFLHADLGLPIQQLFAEVAPTLKLGIRFDWGESPHDSPGSPGFFHYPFGPLDVAGPLSPGGDPASWDLLACSLRSLEMAAGALPLAREGERGGDEDDDLRWRPRFDTDLAYHLDNRAFVAYLARRAAERGVRHLRATVEGVELTEDGEAVASLTVAGGDLGEGEPRRLAFDIYLDCTGFSSRLLGEALGSPFRSFAGSLFTDRAVIARAPLGGPSPAPYTRAETYEAGWCWSTPQRDVDHRGYVFSSAFLSPQQAAAEMAAKIPGLGPWKLVSFASGRRQHFLRGNVAALGNAYGFVEPLESTALHMLVRQIGLLVRSFPRRRGDRGLEAFLNRRVGELWDYLSWFLALHYRFNGRLGTPFWRACREETDVSARGELLEAFRHRGPLSLDPVVADHFEVPDPLWGPEGIDIILLGQGVTPGGRRPGGEGHAHRRHHQRRHHHRRRLLEAVVAGSVSQAEALAAFDRSPELLRRLAAPFEARGPAFLAAFGAP